MGATVNGLIHHRPTVCIAKSLNRNVGRVQTRGILETLIFRNRTLTVFLRKTKLNLGM